MAETSYHVYALKDPRTSPAKPFYIGKAPARARTTTSRDPMIRERVLGSAMKRGRLVLGETRL